jgi:hypothetical protein
MSQATTAYQTRQCVMCGYSSIISVPTENLKRWENGELIQVAFPDFSASDRELLKSGTHSACWDKMWQGVAN